MSRAAGRRRAWVEEQPAPPVDLRLVPAGAAAWLGAATMLLSAWVSLSAAMLIGGAAALVCRRRPGWRPGAIAVVACLFAAMTVTTLRVHERNADPLGEAATRGSWAVLGVAVSGYPTVTDSGFRVPDAAPGDNAKIVRWRVDVVARDATVGGRRWASDSRLTVYGQGGGWSSVVPGEELSLSGRLSQQARGPIPVLLVHARSPPEVTSGAPWWYRAAATMRRQLSLSAADLDGDARGLLPGLVVGDTSGISDGLDADAKATGIAHLLAVSGSHFAILCGFVVIVLRRAGPRLAAVGGSVTMVGLVVLVGPEPSVLRAAVMGGIGMLAILSGRTRTAVPALATAVIGLVLIEPALAVSAGFGLSVLATAGLILLAPVWSEAMQRRGTPRGWADLIAIPLAAQIVTMPVIVLISGTISVVGVLANLVVAPVVAPALVLGVLCALAGPWWPALAGVFAQVAAPLLGWIATVAHSFARWPNATVPWPATPAGALGLIVLTVALLTLLRGRRFRAAFAAAAAGMVLVLVPVQFVTPGWPAAGWLLTACEVGQGDAIVLSTGQQGTAVVVDAGPDPGLVDSCLHRLDVEVVPLMVLTHLHADHVDGLEGVLQGRQVGAIAVGPGREPAGSWKRVQAQADRHGVPIIEVAPGARWSDGALTMTVLGPEKEFRGTDSDPNNDSVVVMAEHADQRILMTGDIEREAQQVLLTAGVDLRADVLKVPHHGSSKLLDSFVQAVSANIAVIGVGVGNDYGQPSERALDTLTRVGVGTVLRTDTDGDVCVGTLDGTATVARRGATTAARGR